jgi:hypothetical protein
MKDGDQEDYAFLHEHESNYAAGTADLLIQTMKQSQLHFLHQLYDKFLRERLMIRLSSTRV